MSGWDEDEDWVPTDLSPLALDRLLDRNTHLSDKWNKMAAWHKGQMEWRKDEFVKAEAEAVMRDTGPATKAKFAAAASERVSLARTHLAIATAQLGVCEHRLKALEREAFNLGMRNKLLNNLYNNS